MPSSFIRDFSNGALVAATPVDLFPEVDYGSIEERFITNPNASGSLWFRFCDEGDVAQTASANGAGSIEIPAGAAGWAGSICNRISVVAAGAATKVTAGER